jgi:hypothetical protein
VTPAAITPSQNPTSIQPTGSDTLTTQPIPSSVTLQPTPTGTESSTKTSTGIPSNLPRIIPPPGSKGLPAAPPDSQLIQIGFKAQLNYNFVISNNLAIQEIFNDLPRGISYGLGIDIKQVVMQSLQPYDTTATYGFITTVAMAYIPKGQVHTLADEITRSWTPLYGNPDAGVRTVMSVINPYFPLIPGGNLNNPSGTGNPSSSTSAVVNQADPLANNNSGSSVSGTTVGIGVGVAAGAALYGAAMFFVAKRYRKRKSLHRRSPSLIDTTSMAQSHGEMMTGAGAALMSGSRNGGSGEEHPYYGSGRNSRGSGRSGASSRGRDISAPVMAENSLGWN